MVAILQALGHDVVVENPAMTTRARVESGRQNVPRKCLHQTRTRQLFGAEIPVPSQDERRAEGPDQGAQLAQQMPTDGRENDRVVHVDCSP
eukprot:6259155-Pyramimonas_sp.AAC.1